MSQKSSLESLRELYNKPDLDAWLNKVSKCAIDYFENNIIDDYSVWIPSQIDHAFVSSKLRRAGLIFGENFSLRIMPGLSQNILVFHNPHKKCLSVKDASPNGKEYIVPKWETDYLETKFFKYRP